MKEIKKIDILSIAKISGLLMGGIYLVVGLVINISVLIFKIPVTAKFDILGFGSGILATFLVALLVGAVNFIIGAIVGWLYNLTASVVGGIRIQEGNLPENEVMFKVKKSLLVDKESLISKSQPQSEVNHILKNTAFESGQLIEKPGETRDTFSVEKRS